MMGIGKEYLLRNAALFLCLVYPWNSSFGQISDPRYSRVSPPGLSEVSQLQVRIELDSESPRLGALISKKVRARLEPLGYTISGTSSHEKRALLLIVRCEGAPSVPMALSIPNSRHSARRSQSSIPPPCLLMYAYQGELIPWIKVDRFIYAEGVSAMTGLSDGGREVNSETLIEYFLEHFEFPVILAAEWGHLPRLVQVLNDPYAPSSRKTLVIRLLGEIQNPKGFPVLVKRLHDPVLATSAAQALGCFALDGRPHLLEVLQTQTDPLLQTAAATGLGKIAATTGDSQPTPLFLEMVTDPTVDIRVKTALVWALGKAPDFRAYPTLVELERSIWLDRSDDPHLQPLREAVNWSIREVKQGGHGDDF